MDGKKLINHAKMARLGLNLGCDCGVLQPASKVLKLNRIDRGFEATTISCNAQ